MKNKVIILLLFFGLITLFLLSMSKETLADTCDCASDGSYYCYNCFQGACVGSAQESADWFYHGETIQSCYENVCIDITLCVYCNYTFWENNSSQCGPSCTPSCGSCSSGTYYSSKPSNYYASGSRTCKRSDCSTYTQTCYSPCPTISSCSSQGYINTGSCPTGSTCVSRTITESVPSECDGTRDCLLVCPQSSCTDYDSGVPEVDWYDTCPTDSCRETDLTIEIEGEPDDCPHYTNKTCYTTNPRPSSPDNMNLAMEVRHPSEVELMTLTPYPFNNMFYKFIKDIKAAGFDEDSIMEYWSDTHSGREILQSGVNNPVGLHAEYSDSNGQEDIVAIYVWWSPKRDKTNLVLPNKLDTTDTLLAQSDTEDNWGFLITRSGYNGTWENVYVPNLQGTNREWVNAGNVDETITINGPKNDSDQSMVQLSGINVRAPEPDGNEIHLDLLMTFISESTEDIVSTGQYNLWGLANDYVGFTEFEITDGEIKDSENVLWTDSTEDWNLDMQEPVINVLNSPIDSNPSEVEVSFTVSDDDQIAHARLDACKSGIDTPSNLTSDLLIEEYVMESCTDFDVSNYNITDTHSLLGTLGTSFNPPYPDNQVVEVGLGDNKEGAITFHLTIMDKAGNIDQKSEIYKLEQWATVKDGFVFGRNGVTSSTRELEDNAWDGHTFLQQFRDSYVADIDLTNQVLLGAKSLSLIYLRQLVHAGTNNSFNSANYPGIFLNSPYDELRNAYINKTEGWEKKTISGTTLSGSLSDQCSTQRCVLESSSSTLNIDNFTCDGKALISVQGDIEITPDIVNASNRDACIILASGNIEIGNGSRKTSGDTPEYDIIEAFLIAGGQINIPTEGLNPPNDDGLYIEGGLISFTDAVSGTSINNEREILFSNIGVYPVLVVDNNSKYGLFGRDIFGTQISILKNEIGFKPY